MLSTGQTIILIVILIIILVDIDTKSLIVIAILGYILTISGNSKILGGGWFTNLFYGKFEGISSPKKNNQMLNKQMLNKQENEQRAKAAAEEFKSAYLEAYKSQSDMNALIQSTPLDAEFIPGEKACLDIFIDPAQKEQMQKMIDNNKLIAENNPNKASDAKYVVGVMCRTAAGQYTDMTLPNQKIIKKSI